jgi:hypothetical protein
MNKQYTSYCGDTCCFCYTGVQMATYKVIQDVEAEDKLVGPLTLRQFIYAGIAALSLYLGFLSATKHAAFMLVIFIPVAAATGFFAFPWGKDQPTEVWALAKIRFFLKPRRRIWDQSGAKELVTITVPKRVERHLTNGLDQDEVRSRLNALANTIDSRGWAIKNVNVNMSAPQTSGDLGGSDRLVEASSLPQEVSNVDVRASDDILDAYANPVAQHFDSMITASSAAHRQQLIDQMQQPATPQQTPVQTQQPPADYWFMNTPQQSTVPGQATFANDPIVVPGAQTQPALVPQAAIPTAEEEALVEKFKEENSSHTVAYGNMKTVKTPEQLASEARAAVVAAAAKPPVTPRNQAAIINLASNDDLDVATIARQAHKQADLSSNGEVVITLR